MCDPRVLLLALLLVGTPAVAQSIPDPMRPARTAASAAGQPTAAHWRLHSTLIYADRRQAVIDGEVVGEGARVGDAVVVAIHPGRVLLRGPDGDVELTLSFTSNRTGPAR